MTALSDRGLGRDQRRRRRRARPPAKEYSVKRLPLIVIAAVSAIALVAAFAFTGNAQTGERTIVLKETDKGSLFNFVDNPPHSRQRRDAPPSVTLGDQLVFTSRLLDSAGNRAGRSEVVCSGVEPGRSLEAGAVFLCSAVMHLVDGDLFVTARFSPTSGPSTTRGSITGGTGAYLGARGEFTSVGEPSTDTFNILP
jgi:hypothetical protein